MRRALPWLLTAVLLSAAWLVNHHTLPQNAIEESFVVPGEVGAPTSSRDLVLTVTDVRAADRVSDIRGWNAAGTWLVIDLEAHSNVSPTSRIATAELVLGARTYRATERGTTLFFSRLVTGVPRAGSIAFELPEGARTGMATLRMSSAADIRADAVIEIALDLDALPVETEVELLPVDWAR